MRGGVVVTWRSRFPPPLVRFQPPHPKGGVFVLRRLVCLAAAVVICVGSASAWTADSFTGWNFGRSDAALSSDEFGSSDGVPSTMDAAPSHVFFEATGNYSYTISPNFSVRASAMYSWPYRFQFLPSGPWFDFVYHCRLSECCIGVWSSRRRFLVLSE